MNQYLLMGTLSYRLNMILQYIKKVMNIIESLQKQYFPGFYNSRFELRKQLAISLKDKCRLNPEELSLYELRIILKVLQQLKILPKSPKLQQKQKQIKIQIVKSSILSSIVGFVPFGFREFHKIRLIGRLMTMIVIFGGVNYCLMRPYFKEYILQCGKLAQMNIGRLQKLSKLIQQ